MRCQLSGVGVRVLIELRPTGIKRIFEGRLARRRALARVSLDEASRSKVGLLDDHDIDIEEV
jgi:hypothetical protein